MADEKSGDGAEKLSDRARRLLGDPVVGIFKRHWIIFILPFLMFVAGLFILYLGSIDCKDEWSKCLTNTDKSYVATGVGFVAASIGLSSWLASFYQEFDRQRFDLFNSLHKEFRTTEQFKASLEAIVKMEMANNQEDPFEHIGDAEAVDFASFFEIVAISVQSNLISAEIANYFFGNYLIIALSSTQFKSKIGYDEAPLYWSLLRLFAGQIKGERDKMTGNRYASSLRI
jgi:hypothetical protein